MKDITPGVHPIAPPEPRSSSPESPIALGDRVVFAVNALDGQELWVSDGTEEGTISLVQLCDGYFASCPPELIRLGGLVIFATMDEETGQELWRSDGTVGGTVRIADLRPGPESSSPHDFVRLGNSIYFIAQDGALGEQLWVTDGQSAQMVDALTVDGTPSWVTEVAATPERLFLAVANEARGAELWVSDGSEAGTRIVRELRPGAQSSYPGALTAVDDVLVFRADDGVHGLELWVSDGTPAGTQLVDDLAEGADSSAPEELVVAGPRLYFRADAEDSGRELWAIDRRALTTNLWRIGSALPLRWALRDHGGLARSDRHRG